MTPDSFSDGGRFSAAEGELERIAEAAQVMLDDGAAILDVGGESTRPGATEVAADEELRRVMPVLERLLELDAVVSLDTRKASVARRALAAGVHLINDVGGGRDPAMLEALADSEAAYCLMHMQGEPGTMQRAPHYRDVVAEVREFLAAGAAACRALGMAPSRLLVDPGFGFGKTLSHNLTLLRHLEAVRAEGTALLVGMSRKRMIGAITGRDLEGRAVGSAAAALLAVQRGADVVRVHDVAETADALRVLAAVMDEGTDRL